MSIESTTIIRVADETDINVISTMAHSIWPLAYKTILTDEQVKHMLNMMYSHEALNEQFKKGHKFLIAEENGETVGYASYSADHMAGVFKVHKLYVHPLLHGRGYGKMLLDRIISDISEEHPKALRLNVNRQNPSKSFYESQGFRVVSEEDVPIGEGFFMSDYIMEKSLD